MFRFYALRLPLHDTDSIGSLTDPRPAGEPSGTRTCEYCKSILTARGEVLQLSERARELRTLEDRLSSETAAHTATKAALATAHSRIAELEAATAPAAPTSSAWGME